MTIWWFSVGLIHHSFIKLVETIAAKKYCREINEMYQKLIRLQTALAKRKGPILLHVNARPQVSMITLQKLHTLNYAIFHYQSYSSDLSPTDFYFYKHLDNFLQEKCFRNPKDAEDDVKFNKFVARRTTTFYNTGMKKTCFSLANVH